MTRIRCLMTAACILILSNNASATTYSPIKEVHYEVANATDGSGQGSLWIWLTRD